MKTTEINALIVGKVLRHSDHKILQDDDGTGAYLVTCETGYCFEQANANGQDGLHELVSDYASCCGTKSDALKHARADFKANVAEPCEAARRGICEWCGS